VLDGGCYGLCDIGPTVVVRRFAERAAAPDPSVDRLTLTNAENETVYVKVTAAELRQLIESHTEHDQGVEALTRQAREPATPLSEVAARVLAVREARAKTTDEEP
jgi:(2Fe-2S) ferredoxin